MNNNNKNKKCKQYCKFKRNKEIMEYIALIPSSSSMTNDQKIIIYKQVIEIKNSR